MLGDENNNELFDLANFDAKKTALLVIDELGDPTGTPLEQTLLPQLRTPPALRRLPGAQASPSFSRTTPISPVSIASCCSGAIMASPTPPRRRPRPLLDPKEGDFTIEKRRYSAFFQTGLRLLLDELGVDHAHLHGNGH